MLKKNIKYNKRMSLVRIEVDGIGEKVFVWEKMNKTYDIDIDIYIRGGGGGGG